MKVENYMNRNVISIKEEDSLENVINILLENKISGAPVVDESNKVIGVISESDLIYQDKELKVPSFIPLLGGFIMLESIRKFEKQLMKMSAYKANQVMSCPPLTINEDSDVKEAVNIMLDNKINRLPVVDEQNKLVGIITRSDILKHIRG